MRFAPPAALLALALTASIAAAQIPLPDSSLISVPEGTPERPTPVSDSAPIAPWSKPALALPALLVLRDASEVHREQGLAAGVIATSEVEMQTLRVKVSESRARVAVKKQEIKVLDAKLKLAKKSKQGAETATLEREAKRLDAELKVLERLEDAVSADLDRATASRDYGKAWDAATRAEVEFVARAAERTDNPSRAMRDLEDKVLSAQRATGEKLEKFAKMQQDVAAKRVRVLDAWGSLQAL